MKNAIGITDDLADIFLIQALREGGGRYFTNKNQEDRLEYADYMVRRAKLTDASFSEKFDRLSQLLILYDDISLPIMNQGFELTGKYVECAKIPQVMPCYFYSSEQVDTEELSDDEAMAFKPVVMSAVLNKVNFSKDYVDFMKHTAGSPEAFVSRMYDLFYRKKDEGYHSDLDILKGIRKAYSQFTEGEVLDYPCDGSYFLRTEKLIIQTVKNFMLYKKFNKNGKFDYYSQMFEHFSSAENVNAAYAIVKTQISQILTLQPAFHNLSEIFEFKKKKKRNILNLRNEISAIEEILRSDGREKALAQAVSDVQKANEALIQGSPSKKIAQWATYISLPLSVFENLAFGTSYSTIISGVGFLAQLKSDFAEQQSKWLFVAR